MANATHPTRRRNHLIHFFWDSSKRGKNPHGTIIADFHLSPSPYGSSVQTRTAADRAFHDHGGDHPRNILAILCLVASLAAACAGKATQNTSSPSSTPAITLLPYTQDVPQLQTAIAAQAEPSYTPEPQVVPAGSPTPVATALPGPAITSPPAVTVQAVTSLQDTLTPTKDSRLTPKYWREWPVVPTLSARAIQVYQQGLALGNNPHNFSRVGDCQSVPAIFMGLYDDKERYWLGKDDEYLQETIDQFAGSFSRQSMAAKDGFGVASVLSPLRANPELCNSNESPLQCEFRIQKPSLAFVAMGTNWAPGAEITFEKYLRQIVEFSIARGVVPILVTKGDNIEKDFKINEAIARVAYDYNMPLFNAWRAIQFLPRHGLEDNGIYLTVDAWNVRDFTGLQTLDSVWRGLSGRPRP